jgi:hypothetical protein
MHHVIAVFDTLWKSSVVCGMNLLAVLPQFSIMQLQLPQAQAMIAN